jgi:hypothetical protein
MSDREAQQRRQTMTPQQRQRRARIAAHTSWAKTSDRAERTRPGTQAFLDRFKRQVDPDSVLPVDLRTKLAENAKIAYMLQLAERSAAARRRAAESAIKRSCASID